MQFECEIIRTSQRKLVSNDNQFEVVFRTNDARILDLGKLPADTIAKVSVNLDSTKKDKPKQENVGYKGI